MRTGRILAALLLVGVIGVALLVAANPAPEVPAISSDEAAETSQPFVIKLHARWCPVCMVTKDEWTALQNAYAGRVRLVVFDFTSDATTEASHLEAGRLGLEAVFEEYVGTTGTVLVVDGMSREVRHDLHGHLGEAEYRAALDQTLSLSHAPD